MSNEVTWALTLFALVCTAIFCTGTLGRLAQWSVSQTLCCLVWLLRAIPLLLVRMARWLMHRLGVETARYARRAGDACLGAMRSSAAERQARREPQFDNADETRQTHR